MNELNDLRDLKADLKALIKELEPNEKPDYFMGMNEEQVGYAEGHSNAHIEFLAKLKDIL